MSTWRIDAAVARDLAAVIGWSPDEDVVALTRALGARVPTGSTAKLEALVAGVTPPGADPEAIARRIVDDRGAGRPEPTWSCWAVSTLMAALVETLVGRPAAVAAIRRIDEDGPPVDVHSLVVVDGLLCDPYFTSVVAGPGSEEVERTVGGVWSRRTDEPDGRWTFSAGNGRWGRTLGYRVLAPICDRDDVATFCTISITYSGAPPIPLALVWTDHAYVEAFRHHDSTAAATRTWTWAPDDIWTGSTDLVEHPDWRAAAADFATRTGIPLL